MDWSAKSAWVYLNAVINIDLIDKARKHGIKVIFIDPRSTNAGTQVQALHMAGIVPGAYFADSWHEEMTPMQYGDWASKLLNLVLPKPANAEAPPVMLDFETHDTRRARAITERFKSHQPARPTAYSNGAFQAPNCPWDSIKKWSMPYFAQCYNGDMSEADAAAVVLEAARYMGDPAKVHPFYGHWGTDQRDGCYFTLERLP